VAVLGIPFASAAGIAGPLTVPEHSSRTSGDGSPGITWTPCAQNISVECGTVPVPVDWAAPGGARIDLALVRRPATDPAARIGTLVDVPGGPGDSGVDPVLSGNSPFIRDLNQRFDIVGYDARGIGRSHPVVCSDTVLAQEPPPVPTGQAAFSARVAYNRRLRADCRARTGPVFDHLDTLSGVHDLEAIRIALGESTLTVRGRSYGTLLGEQYAERYPRRVRAMVLDSVEDHSVGTAANLGSQAVAVQDSFDQFVTWCLGDSSCVLYGRDVHALWARLLARAGRGELRHPDDPDAELTPFWLGDLAEQGFRGPYWPELAQVLDALDASPPATAPALRQLPTNPYPALGIYCADYDLPVRDYRQYAADLRRSRALAPDMRYSTFAVYATAACLGRPVPVNNPQHRLRVGNLAIPVLLVNARHDPATGYTGARNVARQLGGEAVLLTYEGWGHIVYGRSACVDSLVDAYLIEQSLPPRGTSCPAESGSANRSGGAGGD
jgi:pimeloyl-ACP methyl ester carboxylesterase